MNRNQTIKRGVFYANLNPAIGSKQGDVRPCLCVQNNAGNTHSSTIVIVPITSSLGKKALPTYVIITKSCGL